MNKQDINFGEKGFLFILFHVIVYKVENFVVFLCVLPGTFSCLRMFLTLQMDPKIWRWTEKDRLETLMREKLSY